MHSMQGGRLEKRREMIGNVDRQAKKSQSTTTVIVSATRQEVRAPADVLVRVIDHRAAHKTGQVPIVLRICQSAIQVITSRV